MERRLYFLIPDRAQALDVVDDLVKHGIDIEHMHAIGDQRTRMDGLPGASVRSSNVATTRLQGLIWIANTTVFAIAVVAMVLAPVFIGASWWLLLPLGIMSANFLTGLYLNNASNKELHEFRDVVAHGEILLVVDAPEPRATEVEQDIQRHYPEAATGNTPAWGAHATTL
jgi:hypothetical protein